MKIFFILLFYIILCQNSFGQNNTTVALAKFELVNFEESYSWLGDYFTESIISKLSEYPQIKIVDRENLKKVVEEISLQLTGIIDEESSVNAGQLLGAKSMIFGKITKTDKQIRVSCRIVEVESGIVSNSFVVDGDVDVDVDVEQIKLIESQILSKLLKYFINPSIDIQKAKALYDTKALKTINNAKNIIEDLPIIGLDPSRRRKSTKYMLWLDRLDNISLKHKDIIESYLLKSQLHMQLEEYNECSDNINIAEKLDNTNPEIDYLYGNMFYCQKDYQQALHYMYNYTATKPDDFKGWYAIGKINIKLNNPAEATIGFLKSLLYKPYNPDAEESLKTLLRSNSKFSIQKKIKSKSPALYNLSNLYISYWETNLDDINSTLSSINDVHNKFYLVPFSYGLVYYQQENYDDALIRFRQALNLNPDNPIIHRELGKTLMSLGAKESGKRHLRIYLLLADHIPDYEETQKHIN